MKVYRRFYVYSTLDILDEIEGKYSLLEDNPLIGTEYVTGRGYLYRYQLIKRYALFYPVSDGVVLIQTVNVATLLK